MPSSNGRRENDLISEEIPSSRLTRSFAFQIVHQRISAREHKFKLGRAMIRSTGRPPPTAAKASVVTSLPLGDTGQHPTTEKGGS